MYKLSRSFGEFNKSKKLCVIMKPSKQNNKLLHIIPSTKQSFNDDQHNIIIEPLYIKIQLPSNISIKEQKIKSKIFRDIRERINVPKLYRRNFSTSINSNSNSIINEKNNPNILGSILTAISVITCIVIGSMLFPPFIIMLMIVYITFIDLLIRLFFCVLSGICGFINIIGKILDKK